MRVFVAGGTGVIGRRLVPQLVARGHQVTATTTNPGKLRLLERLGAGGVVMDGLDAVSVGEAVAAARPDAIVNQMTALSVAHAGKANPRRADRFFAVTNRLRSEGIDHLLAAAEASGVSHVVSQGHAGMNGIRQGGWVKTEEDLAVEQGAKGVFNIVNDEPAPVSEWLPYLAECVGAKPPRRTPAWLARPLAGGMVVGMMTEGRAFSNAKAKRELGWELRYPSWRLGFKEELG
jgi:nucleoside-diphosphate-sugar epimerase